MIKIKDKLYQHCLQYIEERIENAEKAIAHAQESSQSETKSSAGDKYETGRAMMQQEIDRHKIQLEEAKKLKQILEQINGYPPTVKVGPGSLVNTGMGKFYLSVSAGQMLIDGETYYAISAASPVGKALLGSETGSKFNVNGKDFVINEII